MNRGANVKLLGALAAALGHLVRLSGRYGLGVAGAACVSIAVAALTGHVAAGVGVAGVFALVADHRRGA